MEALRVPLPVARLLRRSHNAKSTRDAHDTAYYAYEFSLKFAAIARQGTATAAPARPALGNWAALVEPPSQALHERELLDLHAWIATASGREGGGRKTISGREFVNALVEYRNAVVGHNATRGAAFYADGAVILRSALAVAWNCQIFLPPDERLVYVDTVQLERDGTRRARVVDLHSELPLVVDPRGVEVGPDVLPHQVCLLGERGLRSLHPWLLFEEEGERLLCFNGLVREIQYLDYVSGGTLRGMALERRFPGASAALRQGLARPVDDDRAGPAEPAAEAPRVAEFVKLARLGQGGAGVVHLARQESLGRLVALKVQSSSTAGDPVAVARFEREILALSRCEHANVVKIVAAGVTEGAHYYAAELVDGVDLAALAPHLASSRDLASAMSAAIAEHRAMLPEAAQYLSEPFDRARSTPAASDRFSELARFFRDAATGLQHLHDNGVLHRDLKPSNLMATWPEGRAVVMDLGLASLEDASVALTRDMRAVVGTLRYMAPEQLQRNLVSVDRRADVFSLGATLYELLAGHPFRDGDSEPRLIEQVLRDEPPPLTRASRRVPSDLATVVHKATARDPRQRYESAAAFAQDLDAFLERRPIAARPPSTAYRLSCWVRREPARATLAGLALLLAPIATVVTGYVVAKQPEIAAGQLAARRERVERALRNGYAALARVDYANAERELTSALREDAGNIEALAGLTYSDLGRQRYAEARSRLEALPADVRTLPAIGRLLARTLQLAAQGSEGAQPLAELGPPEDATSMFIDGALESLRAAGTAQPDLANAQELLERAILASPAARPAFYLYFALCAAANRDFKTAERAVDAMDRLWPDDPSLKFARAFVMNANPSSRPELVIAASQEATEALPTNAIAQFNLAIAQYKAKQYGQVVETCRRTLAADPKLLVARGLLAKSLYWLKRYEEARDEFQRGFAELAKLPPEVQARYREDQAESHDFFGRTWAKLGDFVRAIDEYRASLQFKPQRELTRELLGDALQELKRYPEALDEYQRVIAANPKNASVLSELGWTLHRLDREQEAIDAFERSLAIDAQDVNAHLGLGYALDAVARKEEALAQFREAVRLAPDDVAARYWLASALFDTGDSDGAIAQLDEMTRLSPNDPRAFTQRGLIYVSAGRHDDAFREYSRAVELAPDDEKTHGAYCWAAQIAHRERSLVEELERWLIRAPKDAYALNVLAWTLVDPNGVADLRDPQRALDLARQATLLSQDSDPDMLNTLAEAQFATGDAVSAVATETKAIDLLRARPNTPVDRMHEHEASLTRFRQSVETAHK